jgi:hypothetical protein
MIAGTGHRQPESSSYSLEPWPVRAVFVVDHKETTTTHAADPWVAGATAARHGRGRAGDSAAIGRLCFATSLSRSAGAAGRAGAAASRTRTAGPLDRSCPRSDPSGLITCSDHGARSCEIDELHSQSDRRNRNVPLSRALVDK